MQRVGQCTGGIILLRLVLVRRPSRSSVEETRRTTILSASYNPRGTRLTRAANCRRETTSFPRELDVHSSTHPLIDNGSCAYSRVRRHRTIRAWTSRNVGPVFCNNHSTRVPRPLAPFAAYKASAVRYYNGGLAFVDKTTVTYFAGCRHFRFSSALRHGLLRAGARVIVHYSGGRASEHVRYAFRSVFFYSNNLSFFFLLSHPYAASGTPAFSGALINKFHINRPSPQRGKR